MIPRVQSILDGVSAAEVQQVARAVLESPDAAASGDHRWEELSAVHNDARTLAIVRCSGTASVGGQTGGWSCVVKVIDPSVEANVAAAWNDPTFEEKVYELGLLQDTGAPFRPARCFRVSRPDENVKLFWLEDLGGAPQPPWSLDLYLGAARHIGEFNGRMALDPPDLPFELPVDVHRARRTASRHYANMDSLLELRSDPLVRTALGDVQVDTVIELSTLWGQVHEVSPRLPHGVVFGDCHARNLFPLEEETVAVDWAGLAVDPIGADVSVLIGSGLSWSIDEALMVVQNERQIFDAYVDGLRQAGWDGEYEDVRRAFFTHFPLYLSFSALLPVWIRSGGTKQQREFLEARFGAALEELPGRMPPLSAHIPSYAEELRRLLE